MSNSENMEQKPSCPLWPGWAFYLCLHRVESCRERRAGGRVNERHWLLSASTVPRPLAFIKELYPFTLIKRQCFYLQGDPLEPSSFLHLKKLTPLFHHFSVSPSSDFFSCDLKRIGGWNWCNLYFPPKRREKNKKKKWLRRTRSAVIGRQSRWGFWVGLSQPLASHHRSLQSFSPVVGLIASVSLVLGTHC